MTKQSQEVGNDNIVAQGGRDVTVQVGLTPEEYKDIIHSVMEASLPLFRELALQTANARMEELENKITRRMAEEKDISPEALKSPDFQYVLGKAHHAYARSGEQIVADTLVDLIVDRAKQPNRTRLALTINDAVEKIALLTENEFAELSLVYLLTRTRQLSVNNYERFLEYLKCMILPFVAHASSEDSSYSYLETQGCGQITIMTSDLTEILRASYGGIISNGFSQEQFENQVPEEWRHLFADRRVVVNCLHDKSLWQLNAVSEDVFRGEMKKLNVAEQAVTAMWNLFQSTLWNTEQMLERIGSELPQFKELEKLWRETPIHSFRPNTVGIAIGHANARRVANIDADLAIWIK